MNMLAPVSRDSFRRPRCAAASKAMEVQAFVPLDGVDPVVLEKANHLGPVDPATAKAFCLLREAMKKTARAAVVQYTASGRERIGLVRATDETLGQVVARVKKRGINHPYVKNYLLARTTPLTRARKTLPSFEQTFRKLRENLEEFDVTKVRYDEIQRSALMLAPAPAE